MNEAETLNSSQWPSVNTLANPLVAALIADAARLQLGIEQGAGGCTVVDAGIRYPGSLEAGRRIAEICMGGLGHVNLQTSAIFPHWPWMLSVHAENSLLSCLGSQYAGWSLAHEKFFSLGSGPGRALAGREELYGELGYKDKADAACLVLESDKAPPAEVVAKVAAWPARCRSWRAYWKSPCTRFTHCISRWPT